jgi:hypothetical protein
VGGGGGGGGGGGVARAQTHTYTHIQTHTTPRESSQNEFNVALINFFDPAGGVRAAV